MVRIQLELPDEQVVALDELMNETKLRTRKELFNNALTLFEWAVKQKRAGLTIGAIDQSPDLVKELLMPALENISSLCRLVQGSQHRPKRALREGNKRAFPFL